MNQLKYRASSICNADETGISTVTKPSKSVGAKGIRNVASVTSGELGTNVPLLIAVSAIGSSIPPMFIFPCKSFATISFRIVLLIAVVLEIIIVELLMMHFSQLCHILLNKLSLLKNHLFCWFQTTILHTNLYQHWTQLRKMDLCFSSILQIVRTIHSHLTVCIRTF